VLGDATANFCEHGDVTDAQDKKISASTDSTTLRSRFLQVLTVVVWAILAAFIGGFIVQLDGLQLLRYVPVILFMGYVVWLVLWSPSVTIAPSGVTVRNLVRTFHVSWPAIKRIDTRFALTLFTHESKITAWSAPAPGRFAAYRAARGDLAKLPESTYAGGAVRPGDIPSSDSGLAALYVRRYWEQLRDAGYLDSGVLEGTGVVTIRLRRETIALIVLAVLAVAALVFVPNS
jgi:Bacterial PH domain